MKKISLLSVIIMPFFSLAQTNLTVTNPAALNVLKGIYDPNVYNPVGVSKLPGDIIQGIKDDISPDSIKKYWSKLGSFYNRSSGNQLASSTQGITATFNWVSSKFKDFSSVNNDRLVVSDFTFDQTFCSAAHHKETFAVLPGSSLSDNSVLLFVAHADSRNSSSCPAASSSAKGMEDNATGASLVMELARVMSKFSYNQTIIFLITTGEEQGLYGSTAFASYLNNNHIPVKAVINNDIVGSLYCILPTNPVGCSINNSIDSTTVRLFSGGGINSGSKAWARYIKMEYHENLEYLLAVPSKINIMTNIDRDARSGDHVPFYNLGAMAARLCSFNEPGDGYGAGREHLSADSGGVDTNVIPDGIPDSFFVSFTFLKRNAQINANAIAMAASAPLTPTYTITNIGNNNLRVVVNTQTGYPAYRLGVRTTSYDFDSVYTFTRLTDTLHVPVSGNLNYYASVASRNASQVESLFGNEITLTGTATALAVELSQFSANLVNDNDVLVQWKVENTKSADKYIIERSDDAMHFTAIGYVNATSSYVYSFHDVYPLAGHSYYRLRMVETDHFDFSPTVRIVTSATNHTQIIPSPAHEYIVLKTKVSNKPADITDMQGRKVMNFIVNDGLRVDITNIPPGLYLLRIHNGEVIKFMKN